MSQSFSSTFKFVALLKKLGVEPRNFPEIIFAEFQLFFPMGSFHARRDGYSFFRFIFSIHISSLKSSNFFLHILNFTFRSNFLYPSQLLLNGSLP